MAFSLILFSQSTLANFTKLLNFDSNPGELTASYFPDNSNNKNLVVLLHGCVQSGEALAKQSGFLGLAETYDFSLLVPQQSQSNNIKNCFNWFSEQDTNKNSGETLSIVNMITALKQRQLADNVYIVGLSAGGAMVSSLLVHYPDLFTAGAVIAGIPYPCANSLIKAISCMRQGPPQSASELVKEINELISNRKKLPSLSVWTGDVDNVVNPLNAERLANSWGMIISPDATPVKTFQQGYQRTQWRDDQGKPQVELVEIANLGHGIPVNSSEKNGGKQGDFLLEAPVSAAKSIIDFWQINK
ncbi:extracellular catalytic domain type 1 short-chain-length polyhydroxyalkanoate depolymerase [Cognaticolwellia mytili]|uniref:extracellular catalytic domain type 1 short-chain-length polyhydroxyalkanoate depolymerase n=1 Tax=Cognaticolwellia mytili TaxID=1888913 RepID=UPI001F39EC28|nr:PHB depolymerase family esterase [Cognaticolwellia mytili]